MFLLYAVADGSYLTTVPGCILSLSIVPYPAITRASHMVPPLVLISLSDIVPGLIQMDSIEGQYHFNFMYKDIGV